MLPEKVHVAPDGTLHAERLALVYSDEERDEGFRYNAKDPAWVPVGRTRDEGKLLVDPVFFGEFSRVEGSEGLDAEPAEMCLLGEGAFPHDDSDDAPFRVLCHGCGDAIMPGDRIPGDRGGGYCSGCWDADMMRRAKGEEPRFFFPPPPRRRARTGAGSTGTPHHTGTGGRGEGDHRPDGSG